MKTGKALIIFLVFLSIAINAWAQTTVDCSTLDQAACETGANEGKCFLTAGPLGGLNCETCSGGCSIYNSEQCQRDPCKFGGCETVPPGETNIMCKSSTESPDLGGFKKEDCKCTCNGKPIKSAYVYKPSILNPGEAGVAKEKCDKQCARTCGGLLDCPRPDAPECETCCSEQCGTNYGGSYKEDCQTSCKSACQAKKIPNDIVDIIYMAAGIVGAVMLIIHGIRLALSKDPESRNDAKSSLWHVIIALIIIALAGLVVTVFTSFTP